MTKKGMEKKVLEMVKNGQSVRGWAREVLVDMALDEMEEEERGNK